MSASSEKPVASLGRRAAAEELLAHHRKYADAFARMEDLKGRLRELAKDEGGNFKEEFAGKGQVKVSAPKAAQFKGILPELQVDSFLALPERERNKLVDDKKLIAMTPTYGKPYYGSVTVEVY